MEPDIDRSLYILGDLYIDQGQLAQAEEMYARALKGYRAASFPNEDRI